jgi:hypothetical protein
MFARLIGLHRRHEATTMTESDYAKVIDELDHLLNDYDAPMKPDRVWSLLAEVSRHDLEAPPQPTE